MSAQHHVEVVGDESKSRGVRAVCSCGWFSDARLGRRAHFASAAAKWSHIEQVTGS